jgi:amino acid transporter
LPRVFTRQNSRTGAPWVAILVCAILWAVCYPLGFEKNLLIDVLLTGLSILLEFFALVALRIREPELARPFRVPGGIAGTIVIGLPPLALMIVAVVRNRGEFVGDTNGLIIGIIIIAAGVLFYFLSRMLQRRKAA